MTQGPTRGIPIDTDTSLSANSDFLVASQKATKSYADTKTTLATVNAQTLASFAATTSAQLAGVISDETGSGALVFATSPTLVAPALGTPASGVLTNCTGTATGLTAGSVLLGKIVAICNQSMAIN